MFPRKEEFAWIFHFIITNETCNINHTKDWKFISHYLNQWDELLVSREILIMILNSTEHRTDPKGTLINMSQWTTENKTQFLKN